MSRIYFFISFLRSSCILLICLFLLPACYSPSGGFLPYTGNAYTYVSTEAQPKTVTVVDTRVDEPFFTVDIPPGKQLLLDFVDDEGDDPVMRPDLMRYEIVDAGKRFGRIRNQLTVPNATSRRIDVFIREGPEYADAPPMPDLRVDEEMNRPDYWSPRAGPLPKEDGRKGYDR